MTEAPHLIVSVEQLGGSPYFGFAVQAWASLLATGNCDEHIQLVGWDCLAVVAVIDDEPVGIIVYNDQKYTNSYNIALGYVLPEVRDQHIYTKLWNYLVVRARSRGIREIVGCTRVGNGIMRAVAVKLGRVEESVNLVFKL